MTGIFLLHKTLRFVIYWLYEVGFIAETVSSEILDVSSERYKM